MIKSAQPEGDAHQFREIKLFPTAPVELSSGGGAVGKRPTIPPEKNV